MWNLLRAAAITSPFINVDSEVPVRVVEAAEKKPFRNLSLLPVWTQRSSSPEVTAAGHPEPRTRHGGVNNAGPAASR